MSLCLGISVSQVRICWRPQMEIVGAECSARRGADRLPPEFIPAKAKEPLNSSMRALRVCRVSWPGSIAGNGCSPCHALQRRRDNDGTARDRPRTQGPPEKFTLFVARF